MLKEPSQRSVTACLPCLVDCLYELSASPKLFQYNKKTNKEATVEKPISFPIFCALVSD